MSNRSDVVDLLDRCAASLHPEHVRPLLGSVLDHATADQVASTFAMLADPTRVRIVHALSLAEELCVCDLALLDRKSTRLNSSHPSISYAVFCLKKKKRH